MIEMMFILPNEEMKRQAVEAFEEHNALLKPESGEEYHGQFMVTLEPHLYKRYMNGVDVIIARGATALAVQRLVHDTPVSEIPVSGSDILSAVVQAIAKYGKGTIGIISAANMVYSAQNIIEYFGAELKSYIIQENTVEMISSYVRKAKRDGCDIIIGGIDVCECARKQGLPAFAVPMSKESIWLAITEAKHNAKIRRQEREKALHYYSILNNIQDAIIATEKKDRILAVNPSAEQLLHISARDVGKAYRDVLENKQLIELLSTDKDCNDRLVKIGDISLLVNKRHLLMGEQDYIGETLVLQRVENLQKTEKIIRKKLYDKGFTTKYTFSDIIGTSAVMKCLVEKAKKFAATRSHILIYGETGTGKEVFAQSIHNASSRRNEPFVAVNCAALTPSLLESELFGYAPGAFTGASSKGKEGVFELAHKGTLFLDEVSEIPLDMQGRLLRVLQESEVMRVGGDTIIHVDVRIICACNRSLLDMVKRREFREDLYYRLNILQIRIPPLRERPDDILPLFKFYLNRYTDNQLELTDEACQWLRTLSWRGNTRKIQIVCERIGVLNKDSKITLPILKSMFDADDDVFQEDRQNKRLTINEEELKKLLANHKNNRSAVARDLGISRSTLWRYMKTLGIEE